LGKKLPSPQLLIAKGLDRNPALAGLEFTQIFYKTQDWSPAVMMTPLQAITHDFTANAEPFFYLH